MIYKDDYSYINMNMVNRGLYQIVPFQIRLDRYYTEEEKAANMKFAEEHKDDWTKYCEELRQKIVAENLSLMDILEQHFTFGQYKEDYHIHSRDDYTFWFWCNDLSNTCRDGRTGRDYSYITLSLKKENVKENELIFEKVKELIKDYPAKNIQAIFQYSHVPDEGAIKVEAERIFSLCKGKFINYGSYSGKLDHFEDEYKFTKKGARKYFYKVSAVDICMNVIC